MCILCMLGLYCCNGCWLTTSKPGNSIGPFSVWTGQRTTGITPPVNLKTAQPVQQYNLEDVIQDVPRPSAKMKAEWSFPRLIFSGTTPTMNIVSKSCPYSGMVPSPPTHQFCLSASPIHPPSIPLVTSTHLFNLGQPFLIAGQFCHKGLVLQPLPV